MMERVISKILLGMLGKGAGELKNVLYCVLSGYEITEKTRELRNVNGGWEEELGEFLVRKRVEGRSKGTIQQYNQHLRRMLRYIDKSVGEITEADLFMYISMYKKQREVSNGYLDNQSIIFIDEVESALHPTAIYQFLDMIEKIAADMDLQFFISSHSYFVIKKLALIAKKIRALLLVYR